MKIHSNATTTPRTRALIVQCVEGQGWTVGATAAAFRVSVRTVAKWRARWRRDGVNGLQDRSSRPSRTPHQTQGRREAAILRRRRARWTIHRIATALQMPRSTVGAVVRRHGLGRLPPLTPPPPTIRYEWARPGELVHVDIKALGAIGRIGHRIHGDRRTRVRGIGWEQVHVCIDDATRMAYVEVLPTATLADAAGFVRRAVRWFARRGIRIERLMTDNGSAYRARAFAALCTELGMRHLRTRPYTPRTNGKAERFIQTLLREWAYVRPYRSSAWRQRALPRYVQHYNRSRPHTSLNYTTPLARLRTLAA
ncbi:MAG: IS481 family transposase [Thiohalocapsa sp.]